MLKSIGSLRRSLPAYFSSVWLSSRTRLSTGLCNNRLIGDTSSAFLSSTWPWLNEQGKNIKISRYSTSSPGQTPMLLIHSSQPSYWPVWAKKCYFDDTNNLSCFWGWPTGPHWRLSGPQGLPARTKQWRPGVRGKLFVFTAWKSNPILVVQRYTLLPTQLNTFLHCTAVM